VQFEPNANPTQLINNVMGNSTFGNVVVLKDATYSITTSLIPVSGITVMGSGIGTVLSPTAGITCFSLSSKNNVTITNLSIDGAGTSGVGIKLVASSRCMIEGNWIHGTANSAVFLMTNSTYNHIVNNQIWSTGTTADGAVYLYNGNDYNEISNNWFYGNAKPAIRVGLSKRCDIKNNEILKGSQDGMLIRNSTDCTISGNQVFYNTYYGIRSEGCSRNQYVDNYCERNGFHGMDVSQSHNCQFIGNHLGYNGLYGMHLDNEGSPLFTSDYHLVEANYIFNNTGTGLRITGTNNTRITGNFIRRNGYGTGDKSGLVLVNKACNNTITENTITGNNIYDISIVTSNCADNSIRSGNVFVVLSDVGTRTILKDNIGYVSPSDGSSYSYLVSKVGSNYFAVNGSSGLVEFGPSTNASYVFQSLVKTNTTVFCKVGMYYINYLIPVGVSRFHVVGENWGTEFVIGANAGFNISSASALTDISFENIHWQGNSADYGITSAMPSTMRISAFTLRNCRIYYFNKAGAVFANLVNLEVSHIENNMFYHAGKCFLRLQSYNYECSNNDITGNVFYAGYDAAWKNIIQVIAGDGSLSASTIGAIHSYGNQFYSASTYGATCVAWNITTVGGIFNALTSMNDRYENCRVLKTKSASDSYDINNIRFDMNQMWTDRANSIAFQLDVYTRQTVITNNKIEFTGTNNSFIRDEHVGSGEINTFANNYLVGSTAYLNASQSTRVTGNWGATVSNPLGKPASNKWNAATGMISYYNGYKSTPDNKTTYTVYNAPCYLYVSGGSGVNVTITDGDDSLLFIDEATIEWFRLPLGYKVCFTFTTAPTVICEFE
jgi:parallel beta-helix repeat protein